MNDSTTLKSFIIGDPNSCPPSDVDDGDDLNITAVDIKQEPLALDSIKQEFKYKPIKEECSNSVNEELFADANSALLKRDMIGDPNSCPPSDVDGGDGLNITAVYIKQEPIALDSIKEEPKHQSIKVECSDSVNEELFADANSALLKRDMIGDPNNCPPSDVDGDDLNVTAVNVKQEPFEFASIKQDHKYQPIKEECSDSVKEELYTDTNREASENDEILETKIEIFDNSLENSNTISESKSKQPHKCTVCEKIFKRSSNLKVHLLTHSGIKPHKCAICEKTFTQSSSLNVHVLTHSDIIRHKCTICEKIFQYRNNLIVHVRSHSDIKPHKCVICEKTFTHGKTLKYHVLTHSVIKPHKCVICERTFTQSSHLKVHIPTHSNIKPHRCMSCEKTFTRSSSLKLHLLTHSGIKPHKCVMCEKTFTHGKSLKLHLLTHSGIKPHKCVICTKAFTTSSNLKVHILTHSGMKPHKCTI